MDEKKSASDEWHCFVEELWMIFSSATLCGENMKSASAAPTVSCCCGNLAGLQVFWRCLQTMHRTCVLVHKRPSSAAEQIICCQWNSQGFLLGHARPELFLCRALVYITCLPCGDAKSLGSMGEADHLQLQMSSGGEGKSSDSQLPLFCALIHFWMSWKYGLVYSESLYF